MKRNVLLIEDNGNNRYLATFLLQANGYYVACAINGPAGIEAALAAPPDVILLDIQLPGMDGYEVARVLRSHPSLAAIPIIAVTSYAMPGDREKAFASGFTGYIEKPIDPDTFVRSMEALAGGAANS